MTDKPQTPDLTITPSARALYAEVKVGEQIHQSHFLAVAAAIRFAEAIRMKARK